MARKTRLNLINVDQIGAITVVLAMEIVDGDVAVAADHATFYIVPGDDPDEHFKGVNTHLELAGYPKMARADQVTVLAIHRIVGENPALEKAGKQFLKDREAHQPPPPEDPQPFELPPIPQGIPEEEPESKPN